MDLSINNHKQPVEIQKILIRQNQLIVASTPLITLTTYIRLTVDQQEVHQLHQQILAEIKNFENLLLNNNYPQHLIIAARYCLCTAIDEAVLSKTWGCQSLWMQQSLLTLLHHETWGGERFYIIIDELAKESQKNIDFLELAYFLLSLGFEGKYFGKQTVIREEIRNRIMHRIRYTREKPDKALAKNWRDLSCFNKQQEKSTITSRIITLTILSLITIVSYYNIISYQAARPVIKKLNAIANVSPITTFSEIIQRQLINRELSDE